MQREDFVVLINDILQKNIPLRYQIQVTAQLNG